MKETMTVHKALVELKTIQSRISDEIDKAKFVTTNKHSNTKINGKPVADFMHAAQDDLKSIMTLINRRNAIKQAVTKSNALTTVEIGGKTYTVAEAIDAKANGMENVKALLKVITSQTDSARRISERENGEKLDDRADQYIRNLYENAEMKNLSEEVKKVREDFVASQTVDVLDPIDSRKVMESLRDRIDSFMSDVDAALSVSNALTQIDIEYDTL